MKKQIDKTIRKSSVENAKPLRQQLVANFDSQIKEAIPGIKKGSGRFWTVPLNKHVYFYVSFEFPKWLEGDSRFSIFRGMANTYVKPAENMIVERGRYIKYPYRIHHQLFEFNNVVWNKARAGYFYWKSLMQGKKLHYYTQEQAEYVSDTLFPFAVQEIQKDYSNLCRKFKHSDKALPNRSIDAH
jgi:hypothetical protein